MRNRVCVAVVAVLGLVVADTAGAAGFTCGRAAALKLRVAATFTKQFTSCYSGFLKRGEDTAFLARCLPRKEDALVVKIAKIDALADKKGLVCAPLSAFDLRVGVLANANLVEMLREILKVNAVGLAANDFDRFARAVLKAIRQTGAYSGAHLRSLAGVVQRRAAGQADAPALKKLARAGEKFEDRIAKIHASFAGLGVIPLNTPNDIRKAAEQVGLDIASLLDTAI